MSATPQKSAFVPDGYNRSGYIAETEFYPAVRFKYRPCTIVERQAIRDKIHNEMQVAGIDASERAANEWISGRILEWDLRDPGNHLVTNTANNVARLEPQFHTRLFGILMNEQLCDRDPKTNEPPTDEREAEKN